MINQYQRACKLGEYESCRWAGQLMLKTRAPDLRRTERLLHKACEGLDKKGCILLDNVRAKLVPPASSRPNNRSGPKNPAPSKATLPLPKTNL